jgi:o-succinylbenzoate synthase
VRIEQAEVVPYALPFREPYVTARGRLERRELVLLRIRSKRLEGLGEAAPLSLRERTPLASVVRELEESCRPVLEGADLRDEGVVALLKRCVEAGVSPPVLAAVELALLDLVGKKARRPVWRLLGARRARPIACNATLVAGPPAEVAAAATRWAERGFRTFKLKVGVAGDLDQVRSVREALGPEARIRLDANGAWSAPRAVASLRELEPVGLELVEQPSQTLAELAEVRSQVRVLVAADESVASADDAREATALEACDVATVKLAKVGGIAAARAVADVLPVYLSSALDGPVGIAAAAHVAQVLPKAHPADSLAHGLATAELFEGTIASRALEVVDAALTPSRSAGFGVAIDERALERYRL